MFKIRKLGLGILLVCMLGLNYEVKADVIDSISSEEGLKSCLTATTSNECVLADNITVTESIFITADMSLDLNGKTISTQFTKSGTNAFVVSGGKLIINDSGSSGFIKNDKGYGIYVKDGGSVIFNAGNVETYDAPLAGNNTTGDMNFEVNGGTLTAKYGPAIYMPGQVNLKITGGTLNGGISLRMGQVTISGGTINNTNSNNTDTIEDYYNFSGNVWYGDAIAINSGTYTSSNSTYGNSLNLNITGGTIYSTMGNAVSVYLLGKVKQNIIVNITGGTFTGSDAILVRDMTKESFVSSDYKTVSNTPEVKISGGSFNKSVNAYLSDNYIEEESNGKFVVKPNIELEITDTNGDVTASFESEKPMPNDYQLSVGENTLTDDEKTSFVGGAETKIESLYDNNKTLVIDTTLIGSFDISVIQNGQTVSIEGTDSYKISLKVDSTLVNSYDNFKVLYINEDGNIQEVLDATLENGYIVFYTTHLSTYAVVGYNTTENVVNPQTFDGIVGITLFGFISLIGIVLSAKYLKNKMN